MVVMKLVVKEPSENRKRRQLLPTPEEMKNEMSSVISDKLQMKTKKHLSKCEV